MLGLADTVKLRILRCAEHLHLFAQVLISERRGTSSTRSGKQFRVIQKSPHVMPLDIACYRSVED